MRRSRTERHKDSQSKSKDKKFKKKLIPMVFEDRKSELLNIEKSSENCIQKKIDFKAVETTDTTLNNTKTTYGDDEHGIEIFVKGGARKKPKIDLQELF